MSKTLFVRIGLQDDLALLRKIFPESTQAVCSSPNLMMSASSDIASMRSQTIFLDIALENALLGYEASQL